MFIFSGDVFTLSPNTFSSLQVIYYFLENLSRLWEVSLLIQEFGYNIRCALRNLFFSHLVGEFHQCVRSRSGNIFFVVRAAGSAYSLHCVLTLSQISLASL